MAGCLIFHESLNMDGIVLAENVSAEQNVMADVA